MKTSTWLQLYKTFGYIKGPKEAVVFSCKEPPPKRLLFLFPVGRELFDESLYVFRRLKNHLLGNPIYLAVSAAYRDLLAGPSRATFYFPVQPNNHTRIQMDVMLARFRNQAFDVVINLDPVLNLQMARVISVTHSSWRIGFAGPHADSLYNIQIQVEIDGPLEKAYDQILGLCQIGAAG